MDDCLLQLAFSVFVRPAILRSCVTGQMQPVFGISEANPLRPAPALPHSANECPSMSETTSRAEATALRAPVLVKRCAPLSDAWAHTPGSAAVRDQGGSSRDAPPLTWL